MQVPGFPIQLCDSLSSMSINCISYILFPSSNIQSLPTKSSKKISNSAPFISIFIIIYIFIKNQNKPSLRHSDHNNKRSEDMISYFFKVSQYYCIFLYSLMLKIHTLFLQDIYLIINQHSFLFKNTRETK